MSTITDATLKDLIDTLNCLLSIDSIREQCEARGDFQRHQRTIQKKLEQQEQQIAIKDIQIAAKTDIITAKEAQIAAMNSLIERNRYVIRINQLYQLLLTDNRQQDLLNAFIDSDIRDSLLVEYHL